MPEVERSRLPPPPPYRPPRVTGYNEDEGAKQEESWSDSPSENNGDQKEILLEVPSAAVPAAHTQLRVSRHHRRTGPKDPVSERNPARLSRRHKEPNCQPNTFAVPRGGSSGVRSGPGGQAIRYDQGTGAYPFPRNAQRSFTPTSTQPSAHNAANYFPGDPYNRSHFAIDPYSSPPYQGPQYPPNQYIPNYYPPPHPPINTFPGNTYPPNHYASNPQITPLYPQQQPPLIVRDTFVEDKLERVEKELDQMKLKDKARQQRETQRELHEVEKKQQAEVAAKEKEREQRIAAERSRRVESSQAIKEKKESRRAKRGIVLEIRPEIGKAGVAEAMQEAVDHILRQQGQNSLRTEEFKQAYEGENVISGILQILENRLLRQERRSSEEQSIGSNRSHGLQFVPGEPDRLQSRVDRLEDMLDLLSQNIKVAGHIEETAFNSEKSSTISTRSGKDDRPLRSPMGAKSDLGESYFDQREGNFQGWRYDSREGRGADSLEQSSCPTAVDSSDQFSNNSTHKEPYIRSHHSSDPGVRPGTNHDLHPHLPRATQVPLGTTRGRRAQAGHGGDHHIAKDAHMDGPRSRVNVAALSNEMRGQAVPNRDLGRGQTRRRPKPDQKHSRRQRYATTVDPNDRGHSSSDEAEDKDYFPDDRSSRYAIAQPQDSRQDRRGEATHPPVVPNPPQVERKPKKPNQGSRRVQVADAEDDGT